MSNNIELFTSQIELVETSDSSLVKAKRAIIKIPIINFGSNKKHLMWIPETMKKIAHMFRGVPFRYDLTGGNEGSHVREHISSPFYDVGWTYSDERGAYYDPIKNCVWVQGEVTHPDVIEKLMRETSDGKREINYASMGAVMTPQQTKCSICGKAPYGSCNHERGKRYGNDIAAMVPTDISKALHVALTNDPADKVAEIEQAIFQDMNECNDASCETILQDDKTVRETPSTPALNIPRGQEVDEIVNIVLAKLQEMEDSKMKKNKKKIDSDDIEMSEEQELDKPTGGRKKADDKFDEEALEKGTKVEGEHTTKKNEAEKIAKDHLVEDDKYYDKLAKIEKAEDSTFNDASEEEAEDKKEKKLDKKVKDEKKDVKEAKKEVKKFDKADKKEDKKEEKKKELPAMKEMSDDSEFKISGAVNTKPVIETQDSAIKITGAVEKTQVVEVVDNNIYEEKYRNMLIKELADSYVSLGKAKTAEEATGLLSEKGTKELEIFQDAYQGLTITGSQPKKANSIIPKYKDIVKESSDNPSDIVPHIGGTANGGRQVYAFQDMDPGDRVAKYGDYGAFDLCFHPQNASKYTKNRSK